MAITYPLNLLDDLPGWSTDFSLLYRQEQSRHASGRTRVKDYGTPIWQATYSSKNLSPNQLDYWRARLNLLEGGLKTFIAYPKSRCWPIEHPNGKTINVNSNWVLGSGVWTNSGNWIDNIDWNVNLNLPTITTLTVNSKNANNKALRVTGIPNLTLSVGDFISINNNLHQVMENATAGSLGLTPEFEVRPHLSVNISIGDRVKIYQPNCLMTLVPGSVSAGSGLNGRGSISFQAIESRG